MNQLQCLLLTQGISRLKYLSRAITQLILTERLNGHIRKRDGRKQLQCRQLEFGISEMVLKSLFSTLKPISRTNFELWKHFLPKRSCSGFVQNPAKLEPVTNDYHKLSLEEVRKLDPQTLRITFNNHVSCDFKNIWLRDSCQCESCVHPVTKQKLVNIRELDLNAQPSLLCIEKNSPQSSLKICWKGEDGEHTSLFSANWLYQFSDSFGFKSGRDGLTSMEYASALPPQQLWDKDIIEGATLEVSYSDFMNHQHVLFILLSYINAYGIAIIRGWLYQFSDSFGFKSGRDGLTSMEYASALPPQQLWDKDIIEGATLEVSYSDFMNHQHVLFILLSYINAYGIAIIRDVPVEMHQILKVAQRISFVKQTTYGLTFQVVNKPDPKTHLSYTGRRFELHTDLSYMQNAPSIQLLHCLEAAHPDVVGHDAGGMNFFADAYYSANWLRTHHPDFFKILTDTKLLFTFQDAERGRWFRMERPLIEANGNGDIIEMYWSDFSMRPPLIPPNQIVPFYQAYRCLADKLNEENSLLKFYLSPGDLVIFNNKRVLHGREEYDASKVRRHLEGCYIDLQEAMSLFESLLVADKKVVN